MSFVSTVPDLIEAASGDLAGIGSTLHTATTAAAAPTTGLAAAAGDEVSAAIAALFGAHGQEFQALNAEAAAFHDTFVRQLNSGIGAYLQAEAANAAATGLSDVAGPYQRLFVNTGANLQALQTAIAANPQPLLRQFLANQQAYGQTILTAIEGAIQGFPAGVPAAVRTALQELAAFDPAAFLQWSLNNQIGYAQTIGSALNNAAADFVVGLQALPATFQTAFQQLVSGDIGGAVGTIGNGFVDLFLTGIDVQTIGGNGVTNFVVSLTPTGSLAELLPILALPGEVGQNITNIMPTGSPIAQITQNLTNVYNTVADTSIIADASVVITTIIFPPSITASLNVVNFYGVPVALLLDGLGAPYNAATALGASVNAFTGALQTGDWAGAAGALIDAPAVVTDGLLNGQQFLTVGFDVSGHPGSINLPMDGLLVPVTPYTATLTVVLPPPLGTIPLTGPVTGTPISGLIPALFTYLPEQLADAITPMG